MGSEFMGTKVASLPEDSGRAYWRTDMPLACTEARLVVPDEAMLIFPKEPPLTRIMPLVLV
jgi:hypothetical protein